MRYDTFHILFIVIFVLFTLVRARYLRHAQQTRGASTFKEGRTHIGLRLVFGIPFMTLFFAYLVYPPVLGWFQLDLPAWLRWVGVVLGFSSAGLILWVHRALGENFSTVLHVRDEHTLVTSGPYRWVRHPMYSVLYIHGAGLLLTSGNWFIGGVFLVGLTAVVVPRVAREEGAMLEKFGDEYRRYMERSGRFFPRIGRVTRSGEKPL